MRFLPTVFRHRNYRMFYTGETISLTGLWMQRIAMNWFVYGLTGSSLMLGIIDFTTQIPILLFSGFTGAIMEGRDLRKLVMFCQSFSMLHAFTIAALTLSGLIRYEYIVVLALIIGISDSFEIPARQSLIPKLIDDPKDLSSGIALISMLFNITRLIGPSIAGFLIAFIGEGLCFLLNGVSYAPTLLALALMRFTKPIASAVKPKQSIKQNLREGISYVKNFIPIRNSLIGMSLISFFAFPYLTLTTVFARDILGGKPYTLGFLMAATGCGALLGAFRLSLKKTPVGLMREMGISAVSFGIFLVAFSASSNFYLSLLFIGCVGFCSSTCVISCSTVIQTLVDDDKRSRVMSLHVMATIGATPIGSICTGAIASALGAPVTLGCWGAVTLLVGAWLIKINGKMRELAQPVFERKGHL